uniref:DH domain-containing protein n=2 Tax=Rhizochromulina marina TaxID=1034831 RepID=A0A7S2W171_9STRA|mmetsp:Transcript_10480/g.29954  ORF Transcript_10480/g.29954 Transcript_10480/m.29954 type:complete len:585 (+) Transcript_10480:582-2336(+)
MARRRARRSRLSTSDCRAWIRKEIVEKEAAYVKRLQVLVHGFEQPIRSWHTEMRGLLGNSTSSSSDVGSGLSGIGSSSATSGSSNGSSAGSSSNGGGGVSGGGVLLSEDELDLLFSHCKLLLELNRQLLGNLEDAVEENQPFGPLFKTYARLLVSYSQYFENYDKSVHVRERLRTRGLEAEDMDLLRMFVVGCECQPHCQGFTLIDHLFEPFAHIRRYKRSLLRLLKFTNDADGSDPELEEALKELSAAAKAVTLGIKDRKNRDKTLLLARGWRAEAQLIAPQRTFVFQGGLQISPHIRQDGKTPYSPVEYEVVLFDDILAFGKRSAGYFQSSTGTGKVKLEAIVPLDRCLLLEGSRLHTLEWSLSKPPPSVGKKREVDPAEAEAYVKECVTNNAVQHLGSPTEGTPDAAGDSNVRESISVNNRQSISGRRRRANLQDSSPAVMALHAITSRVQLLLGLDGADSGGREGRRGLRLLDFIARTPRAFAIACDHSEWFSDSSTPSSSGGAQVAGSGAMPRIFIAMTNDDTSQHAWVQFITNRLKKLGDPMFDFDDPFDSDNDDGDHDAGIDQTQGPSPLGLAMPGM